MCRNVQVVQWRRENSNIEGDRAEEEKLARKVENAVGEIGIKLRECIIIEAKRK